MSRVEILYDKDISLAEKEIICTHDKAVISAAGSSVQLRWTKHHDYQGRELFRLIEQSRPTHCLCELALNEIASMEPTALKRIIITKERAVML